MKCGFIGLGDQGAPIARRMIDAGFPVALWARRPETLKPFAGTAGQIVSSIAALGAEAEHVGICVVDDEGLKEVCGALIPAMRKGGRIAVHSTVHPETCVALAAQAGARGLQLIDAPVSGGNAVAAAGKLAVMVGGDKDAVAAARPVFETFGALIVHLGGVGAGQKAKLINNALLSTHFTLGHHGLSVGATLGLDRAALVELIKASSGRSYGFEAYARLPKESTFARPAMLLTKDLRLLRSLGGKDPSFAALNDVADAYLSGLLPDEKK